MYAEAAIVAVLHPLTGASIETARIQPIERMSDRGPSDLLPEQFKYDLAGRILVALMGTMSVLFVGLAAMRLAEPRRAWRQPGSWRSCRWPRSTPTT